MPWGLISGVGAMLVLVAAVLALRVFQARSTALPAPSQQPAPSGATGRLLVGLNGGLALLNLAGTNPPIPLVASPQLGQVTAARWSPDSSMIAYSVSEVRDRRYPVSEVGIIAPDGTNSSKVLRAEETGVFYQWPVWDPDGKHLYVTHVAQNEQGRIRRIERVEIDSGNAETLLDQEIGPFDVSPDGRWLVYVRYEGGSHALSALDLGDRNQRVLIPAGQFDQITSPRFDPTSQTIAFAGARTGGASVRLRSMFADLFGVPSAHAHGAPQDIFSVPLAGGEPTRLVAIGADEPIPAWSPDSRFMSIFTTDALTIAPLSPGQIGGGSQVRVLTPGGAGALDWGR